MAEQEETEPPRGFIETSLGTLEYVLNASDHVYLSAGDANEPFRVNRVDYRVNAHLYLIDGVWKLRNYQDLYMRRPQSFEEASFAAREKTEKVIVEAWREFIRENPGLLAFGEIHDMTVRLRRVEEDVEALEEKLKVAREEKAILQERLRDAGYYGPRKQDWGTRF